MITNHYSTGQRMQIAGTIWQQLGAQRFSFMTGCKPLCYGERDGKVFLRMSVGRNCHAVNRFEVAYNEGQDLYEVSFMRKRGDKMSVVAEYDGVYCDMLHQLFEQNTGMSVNLKLTVAV